MVLNKSTETRAHWNDTPGDSVKIRWMTFGDIPSVLSIEDRSFPTPWSEAIFREEIQSPLCSCLVALIDYRIVGYIDFSVVWDEVHLRNIAVRPEFRNKGVASILLAYMITEASKKGARWVTLEVRRSNRDAIGLYEKIGFILTGVRPLYYQDTGEDALIMWMDLEKERRNSG